MNAVFEKAFSLEGQRAVITGGASGLGFAMAKCMADAGADVVLIGRSAQRLKKACEEIGPKASFYPFDVTDTGHAQALADRIIGEKGRVTILCNNAGNHCKKPIEETTVEDLQSVLTAHVVGAFALTKAFVPHMKANHKGSIIFTSSMTGFIGMPYVICYAAAKSAYLGMVRTLATEVSADGVRVNAVVPGWIDTVMMRNAIEGDKERENKILSRTPMRKFGTPEDIGWACVFLSSDAAKFINGIALTVDGGAKIGF